ncbi:MAG TPA: CAP domain-containing protein [Acidimicrobiales bacterium]|nr:CAP domain-containing protein [Acidimicrobiales bacterium]
MPGFTSRRTDLPTAARFGRRLRRAAALLAAGAAVATGASLATATAASAECAPGSIQLGTLCLVVSRPPVTAAPTTTTTTAPPAVDLPPVTVPPAVVPAVAGSLPSEAHRLLDLVNGERAKAGLGAIAWRDDIAAIAVQHSMDMAQAGDIFHNTDFFSAGVKRTLNAAVRGENVAFNIGVDEAHLALMNSPGHRANILDSRFSVAGFSVVRTTTGTVYVTEDFIQPAGAPRSAAPVAPRPVAPRPVVVKAPRVVVPRRIAPTPTTAAPVTAPPTLPPTTEATTALPPTTAAPEVHLEAAPAAAAPGRHLPLALPLAAGGLLLLAGGAGARVLVILRRR